MLQGLLPTGELTARQLERTLLDGRFCEIRMLFYVGKDLSRWIEQCLEMVKRENALSSSGIVFQSFAALLIDNPPAAVRHKLRRWGVVDYKAIFSRALGLNAVFREAPDRDALSDDFIREYYRYADHMFACRQRMAQFEPLEPKRFDFELYASGEYTRMLEREWDAPSSE
jgi:hypothetical protein